MRDHYPSAIHVTVEKVYERGGKSTHQSIIYIWSRWYTLI